VRSPSSRSSPTTWPTASPSHSSSTAAAKAPTRRRRRSGSPAVPATRPQPTGRRRST
jgi:hypothetical protein